MGDVRAPNPLAAFGVVKAAYPDAVARFVSERSLDWTPSDRFPTSSRVADSAPWDGASDDLPQLDASKEPL